MSRWLRFAARRLVRLVGVCAALVLLTFGIVHLIPGDPARAIAGAQADEAAVERAREEYGLNDPLPEQFADYVAGLARFDLGTSFQTRESVADVIGQRIGATAEVAIFGIVIVLVMGFSVGLLGAGMVARGRRGEQAFSISTGALAAVPHYLMATFLVFLFAITLRWFPVAGAASLSAAVLPAFAIALRPGALVARIVRVEASNALSEDYVRVARSKRISRSRLYLRHVLPNAVTGALTITGLVFATLVGGTIIIEQVFARPGLGKELVESILLGDYPVVQGIILVLGAVVVFVNALVDMVLALVDPRTMEER